MSDKTTLERLLETLEQALNEAGQAKEEAGRSERGRLLAIAFTQLETALLFAQKANDTDAAMS